MDRISRDEMLIAMAFVASKRSTCMRKQVGAVISMDGRVLSIGYAGAPAGMPHCSPEICDIKLPCNRTVHAESNAIAFAAKMGIALNGSQLTCTMAPCFRCSQLIINAGINRVVYLEQYRLDEGIRLLSEAGVETYYARSELQKMFAMAEL